METGQRSVIILAILLAAWVCGCTRVFISTNSTVGTTHTAAEVNGSAWAQVNASSEATTASAKSTAGREHPVSNNAVNTARVLGAGAIAAGALSGNAPLAGTGAGALAASFLPVKKGTR